MQFCGLYIDRELLAVNIIRALCANALYYRLKERRDKRTDEQIASLESGKAELQKVAEEIEEAREKAAAEVSTTSDVGARFRRFLMFSL